MKIRDVLGRFPKGKNKGSDNHKWLGEDVGYFALHTWINRELGRAVKCETCGSINNVWWANKSHKYKRDREDWKQLCCICHRKHDGITKVDYDEIIHLDIKKLKQKEIAKIYNVDASTISKALKLCRERGVL